MKFSFSFLKNIFAEPKKDMVFLKKYFRTTFFSLSIKNYRLYFIGQAISLSGTWMQTVGQGLLVLKLTNSGTALGIVTALQFLPMLFLAPIGGLIADIFPKRKILFITQALSGILAFILWIFVANKTVTIWIIDILALCLGFVNTVDNPTRQTFVEEMVGKEYLGNAVTLNSSEINLARVIGPAIAGILISTTGFAICFLLNSLSFIAVLIVLIMMNGKKLISSPHITKTKGRLSEGFSYAWSSPILRNTIIMMAIVGTLTYEFQVSLPILAQFGYHNASAGYAILISAMGIGSVFGGLIIAGIKRTSPNLLVMISFLFGSAIVVTSFMPTLFLAAVGMFVVGTLSINFTSLGNVILQLESKPEMRGRVMALWSVAFLGSTPIGGPIVGWIGETIGARWGLAIGGIAALLAGVLGVINQKMKVKPITPQIAITGKETENIEKLRK